VCRNINKHINEFLEAAQLEAIGMLMSLKKLLLGFDSTKGLISTPPHLF